MISNCPEGHLSSTPDYCDVCGAPMSAPVPAAVPVAPSNTAVLVCPSCGADRGGRFCEVCGYDSAQPISEKSGTDGPTSAWFALVEPDRDWFEQVRRADGPDASTVTFPEYCPPRRFSLEGTKLSIGRRSRTRGIEPDIDLTGPPMDPGISAMHAMLLHQPDDTWHLVDLDSTNGTTVNDQILTPHAPIPLTRGDRITLGAWTLITLYQ